MHAHAGHADDRAICLSHGLFPDAVSRALRCRASQYGGEIRIGTMTLAYVLHGSHTAPVARKPCLSHSLSKSAQRGRTCGRAAFTYSKIVSVPNRKSVISASGALKVSSPVPPVTWSAPALSLVTAPLSEPGTSVAQSARRAAIATSLASPIVWLLSDPLIGPLV